MHQPGHLGPGNDMDMIPSYGGSDENQQSSTIFGGQFCSIDAKRDH